MQNAGFIRMVLGSGGLLFWSCSGAGPLDPKPAGKPAAADQDSAPASAALAGPITGTSTLTVAHDRKCLEIGGGSTADGATANQWDCTGSRWQSWVLTAVTSTADSQSYVYTIKNGNSGKCLMVAGEGRSNGDLLVQSACIAGNASQMWALKVTPTTGQYDIVNWYASVTNNGNKCLEIGGAITGNGQQADIWGCAELSHQHWSVNVPTYCTLTNAGNAGPELRDCLQKTADYGTVYVPPGTYTLNDSVVMARGITLSGNAGAVVLRPSAHAVLIDFPDIPNQARLSQVTVDYSAASGYINIAQYLNPAKPSPIVLAQSTAGGTPVTQTFFPGHSLWGAFARSSAVSPPSAVPVTSEGFSSWTWGDDGYVYLRGEMRDPLEANMPSYVAGNDPPGPGHPANGLAYAYLNALVGPQYAIDSPGQVNYQFRPFPSQTCPTIHYNGASDAAQGVEAVKSYHLRAWVALHDVIDFGGDIGFQDSVAIQILSNFEDTTTNPPATEIYYLSPQWGWVKYTDNKLNLDNDYNKFVAAGSSLGNLYAKGPNGAAYYNPPGPLNCLPR